MVKYLFKDGMHIHFHLGSNTNNEYNLTILESNQGPGTGPNGPSDGNDENGQNVVVPSDMKRDPIGDHGDEQNKKKRKKKQHACGPECCHGKKERKKHKSAESESESTQRRRRHQQETTALEARVEVDIGHVDGGRVISSLAEDFLTSLDSQETKHHHYN